MKVVGRGKAPAPNRVFAGRPSALGNPYVIGRDGTRTEVIEMYRAWLWKRIQGGGPQLEALKDLKGDEELSCFCMDSDDEGVILRGQLRCHSQVIWRAWKYLQK